MMAMKSGNIIVLTIIIGAAALAITVKQYLTTPYDALYDKYGAKYKIPSNMLRAIGKHESGFKAKAVGPTGDIGVQQINPVTGAALGFSRESLFDPETNIHASAKTLDDMRKTLGAKLSIYTWTAAYNVGPKAAMQGKGQDYAAKVLHHYQLFELGRVFA